MPTIEGIRKPQLTFGMLGIDKTAIRLATEAEKDFFGRDSYDIFKRAGKRREDIPEEIKQAVDREVYTKTGQMFGIRGGLRIWEKFWDDTIVNAITTHDYVRDAHFPEQDRRATLTTNIAWSDRRPSSMLEVLTAPTNQMGEQCKYEQGLILATGFLCAEVMSTDENGDVRGILSKVNNFLESKFFTGRKGDPKPYHVYSYHTPGINKLVGLSDRYPDPQFTKGLWVKSLDYPVRFVGDMPVLYDPREKHVESAVVKIMQRSLQAAGTQVNGGRIEAAPYTGDTVGFRVVPMYGGRLFRDQLTHDLEELFKTFDGYESIEEDDGVNKNNGSPDRVVFRRRQIKIKQLKTPIEMIVETLEDYIAEQYEVGIFDKEKGMHNGPAHPIYKLWVVTQVVDRFWPPALTNIDLPWSRKNASHAYATSLGRKQRIDPLPFAD